MRQKRALAASSQDQDTSKQTLNQDMDDMDTYELDDEPDSLSPDALTTRRPADVTERLCSRTTHSTRSGRPSIPSASSQRSTSRTSTNNHSIRTPRTPVIRMLPIDHSTSHQCPSSVSAQCQPRSRSALAKLLPHASTCRCSSLTKHTCWYKRRRKSSCATFLVESISDEPTQLLGHQHLSDSRCRSLANTRSFVHASTRGLAPDNRTDALAQLATVAQWPSLQQHETHWPP